MLARTPSGSLASMTWNSIVRRRSSTSSSVDPGDSPTSRPVTATPRGERSPMGMATIPGAPASQMKHAQRHVPGAAGDLGKDRRRQQRKAAILPGSDGGQIPEGRGGGRAARSRRRWPGAAPAPGRGDARCPAPAGRRRPAGRCRAGGPRSRGHPDERLAGLVLRASSGSGHRPTASTTTATTATTARALAGAGRSSGWGRQNWCW